MSIIDMPGPSVRDRADLLLVIGKCAQVLNLEKENKKLDFGVITSSLDKLNKITSMKVLRVISMGSERSTLEEIANKIIEQIKFKAETSQKRKRKADIDIVPAILSHPVRVTVEAPKPVDEVTGKNPSRPETP